MRRRRTDRKRLARASIAGALTAGLGLLIMFVVTPRWPIPGLVLFLLWMLGVVLVVVWEIRKFRARGGVTAFERNPRQAILLSAAGLGTSLFLLWVVVPWSPVVGLTLTAGLLVGSFAVTWFQYRRAVARGDVAARPASNAKVRS